MQQTSSWRLKWPVNLYFTNSQRIVVYAKYKIKLKLVRAVRKAVIATDLRKSLFNALP